MRALPDIPAPEHFLSMSECLYANSGRFHSYIGIYHLVMAATIPAELQPDLPGIRQTQHLDNVRITSDGDIHPQVTGGFPGEFKVASSPRDSLKQVAMLRIGSTGGCCQKDVRVQRKSILCIPVEGLPMFIKWQMASSRCRSTVKSSFKGQSEPLHVDIGKHLVGSVGRATHQHYRVPAHRKPEQQSMTLAAFPTTNGPWASPAPARSSASSALQGIRIPIATFVPHKVPPVLIRLQEPSRAR